MQTTAQYTGALFKTAKPSEFQEKKTEIQVIVTM